MAQGMKRDKALSICGISKHQLYHQPTGGRRGRRPSEETFRRLGEQLVEVPNEEVKEYIRKLFDNPLVDYGYHRMTGELTLAGFYINHKKVYRLMKEARLLRPKADRSAKRYVKYRVICPTGPLQLMEMDIKMVWIGKLRRYAYVLTILDVFTRVVLHWRVGFHMKQDQVQAAWEEIIENHLQPAGALAWVVHIEVRNDNGPQFCAESLRRFMIENYLVQTFTHPYTPQENGHIESFHAILSRTLEGQYFEDLLTLRTWLENFYDFYNYERIHGSTVKLPPMTFYQQWNLGRIERKVLDEKGRKVRFALKVQRQEISKIEPMDFETFYEKFPLPVPDRPDGGPADNASRREVSSPDCRGSAAPSIPDQVNAREETITKSADAAHRTGMNVEAAA